MTKIALKMAVPKFWVESVQRVLGLSKKDAQVVAKRLWLA